jgi:glutamine synthetase
MMPLPKHLMLSPDMNTLREMPWQKNEAFVLADVYHPETEALIPYAPRNLLKKVL